MRGATLLTALLLLTAGLAGCLDGHEPLEPASAEDADGEASGEQAADGSQGDAGDEEAGPTSTEGSGGQAAGTDGAANGSGGGASAEDPVAPPLPGGDRSLAVIAHIDTGINPYHEAFRDDSALADVHPSHYIDGYPEDAKALNLTLDAPNMTAALEADEDVWANVTEDQLYWIPGTRIDGAVTFGAGGTYCGVVGLPHDYIAGSVADFATDEASEAAGTPNAVECPEDRPILDDFGHGTMTASRAAGEDMSLCQECRIVSVEGLGGDAVTWVADRGWVDVQTNSWVDLVPAPANQLADGTTEAVHDAAQRMVTVFASGNGAGYIFGAAPTPTYTLSTGPPGVVLVGAHDNGNVATWSGSPPHVISDGFRGLAAHNDSMTESGPTAFSCCTSSSAPYAAGGAAHIVQTARALLDDASNGAEEGVLAEGAPSDVHAGPLADGDLTVDEVREVLLNTAQHPPQEGPHDGRMHWTGDLSGTPEDPKNPAENPYCGLCWTSPVAYEEIPEDVPTYAYTGYGNVNPDSMDTADRVLLGVEEMPEREQADAFYEADQTVRELLLLDG